MGKNRKSLLLVDGEHFFKFNMGKNRKGLLLVDGGILTHDPKTHCPAGDAIC